MSGQKNIEATILRVLHSELKKAGFVPVKVWDDGEYVETPLLRDVEAAVFSVEVSTIHFAPADQPKAWGNLGVMFVCGNGVDCLSDWHCGNEGFSAAMERISERVDAMDARS